MSSTLRAHASGPGWRSVTVSRPPFAEAAPWVATTTAGRPGRDGVLRLLPDACVDLVWTGGVLVAAWTGAAPMWVPLRRDAPAVGLRLRPGVGAALLGPALHARAGRVVAVADLPNAPPVQSLERGLRAAPDPHLLLQEWVVAQRVRPGPDDVVAALSAPGARVAQVARSLAMGERTLRRTCCERVGLAPKPLARVLRGRAFRARLPDLAAGASLASVAAELGYADQAHLARECAALAACSPARLVATWRAYGR